MRGLAIWLAVLAMAPCAYATQDVADPQGCFVEVPISAALVAEASEYGFNGYEASERTPAFLTGHLSPTRDSELAQDLHGTVVFIRLADGGWRAFAPHPGDTVQSVYLSERGELIFVTMWTSEGPGPEWTLVSSRDGLQTARCGKVPFPDTLNEPYWANEFLSLIDLDIDARGRGEIIGVANTEDRGQLWYRYRTRNGGATWSPPSRLSRERAARDGIYDLMVADEFPDALAAELTAWAAER